MRIQAQEAPETTGAELAVLTPVQIVPSEFFKPNGSDEVLARLEAEVRSIAAKLDISTETNRAAIASLAYKIARSKTALDESGKKLTEDLKKQTGEIDAERRRMRDRLDALKEEVRKPLTDWENAEKTRVQSHEDALKAIEDAVLPGVLTIAQAKAQIAIVENLAESRAWEEFAKRAAGVKAVALQSLNTALREAEEAEAARQEAERKAAEERERQIREREEAAARAAAEVERRKAEEQARLARESAEKERLRIENERIEAEARAKQAEANRIAAEEKAKRDAEAAEQRRIAAEREAARQLEEERARAERERIAAAEKAERNRLAAIESERQRVAEEKRREAEEAEKRARNRAHQAAVNREAAAGLVALNLSEDQAKLIVGAIAKGTIPHVKIEY